MSPSEQVAIAALGDLIGGALVTGLFFAIQSRREGARSRDIAVTRTVAAKSELLRIKGVAERYAATPHAIGGLIETSFLRSLLRDSTSAKDVSGVGGAIATLQERVDLLNAALLRFMAETVGIAGALSGNEEDVARAHDLIQEAAKQVVGAAADCYRAIEA